MKAKIDKKLHYFIDESGDPTFYNKHGALIVGGEGSSTILILGFIVTPEPGSLRQTIDNLHQEIAKDDYLKSIPSWEKSIKYFHAKDDCPEIREKVYKSIKELDFKAQFIVARKVEKIFKKSHQSEEKTFYFDLVTKLLKNRLHLAEKTNIYFAKRGNKTKQEDLNSAILKAVKSFEMQWKYKNDSNIKLQAQTSTGEPCLQIIDYMNWAVQRLFIKGEERYYKFIEDKISLVWDLYDVKRYKHSKNIYAKKNKLRYKEISPI